MRKLALDDDILLEIEKPARYIGGEVNAVMKNVEDIDVRFAMCFPDVYEIGMSHLGIQILYDMFNRREDVWCERVYSPWHDLDKVMREQKIPSYAFSTSEINEIHSMSMEYFAYNWMELFFGDRKDDYLKMHLEDSAAFVPYGCMVDEFQHIVYEKPEMTPAERKAVWAGLEKVYRPHMDYEEDPFFGQGGFWQKQPHIFGSPFYYIDYCLASVCAMQFKVMMDEDFEKAWKNYYKLCNLSARDFFTNVIVEAGLNSPFEDGCMEKLVDKFEKKAFNR